MNVFRGMREEGCSVLETVLTQCLHPLMECTSKVTAVTASIDSMRAKDEKALARERIPVSRSYLHLIIGLSMPKS